MPDRLRPHLAAGLVPGRAELVPGGLDGIEQGEADRLEVNILSPAIVEASVIPNEAAAMAVQAGHPPLAAWRVAGSSVVSIASVRSSAASIAAWSGRSCSCGLVTRPPPGPARGVVIRPG